MPLVVTCRISLRRGNGAARLTIDDDGAGFDASAVHEGMGLKNLRDRIGILECRAGRLQPRAENQMPAYHS